MPRTIVLLTTIVFLAACASTGGTGTAPAPAGKADLSAMAKESQNPLSSMYSLPLQNNTAFGIGPHDRTANVLNIQPVLPFEIGDNLLINRIILPVMYAPYAAQEDGGVWGIGDTSYTAWISPPSDGIIWGVGPVFEFPTATDDHLGTGKWSAGPSAVALRMSGPWVYGGLANNLWSYGGDSSRERVNRMLAQPFVNYNLSDGWSLTSAPIITADWTRDHGDRWVVPLGGGVGKVTHIGRQVVSLGAQAYYNIVKPDQGADWSLRLVVTFMFPKPPSVPKED
ncbi:MAG: neuromedin U [Planctomycetota bacterium]